MSVINYTKAILEVEQQFSKIPFFKWKQLEREDPEKRYMCAICVPDGPYKGVWLVMQVAFPYHPIQFPAVPPVIHKYTKTGRFNADFYDSYADKGDFSKSSLCLNILRPPADGTSGWKVDGKRFPPMDSVMQSILAMLSTYYVPQDYGDEAPEPVKMEQMAMIRHQAEEVLRRYQSQLPPIPHLEMNVIPEIVQRCTQLKFPLSTLEVNPEANTTLFSHPLTLTQLLDGHWFGLNVDCLRDHPTCVVSIMLTNTKTVKHFSRDSPSQFHVYGNGVTGQARFTRGPQLRWLYHGKPFNQGDVGKVFGTLSRSQHGLEFTLCTVDKNGNFAVHGDSAVKVVNFPQDAPEWKQDWQIVIFVHNKGFIPITLPFLPASYNPRGLGLLQPSCKWSKSVYEDGKYVAGPMPLTEKDFQSAPVRTPQADDVPDIEDLPDNHDGKPQVPLSSVPASVKPKRLPTYVALTANATVTRELLNLARDYWCKAFYPQARSEEPHV